jgi:hypothetical protein
MIVRIWHGYALLIAGRLHFVRICIGSCVAKVTVEGRLIAATGTQSDSINMTETFACRQRTQQSHLMDPG